MDTIEAYFAKKDGRKRGLLALAEAGRAVFSGTDQHWSPVSLVGEPTFLLKHICLVFSLSC
jgi:hypothetical protein